MDAVGGKRAARRILGARIAALFACIAFVCLLAPAAGADVVKTDRGAVSGTETATVKEYLGIPYAAPPVGDLRWRPPQVPAAWTGTLDATHFANHCPQKGSPFGTTSVSEDCLYLNVYTPKSIIDAKGKEKHGKGHLKNLPVMFWIHGGGFVNGESDTYDPTRLVQKGVVVVTINYRLGALGFLAHPALTAEGGGSSSNYGLMDQQAALRWVKRNIPKFGGDFRNVTIFGESAGGFSVLAHLVSPLSASLFHKAITQSGSYGLSGPSLATAEAQGTSIAQNVGCGSAADVLACLRATPVSTLSQNLQLATGELTPPVDGRVLPKSLGAAIANGEINRVPVIEGSTHDEFSLFYKTAIEDPLFNGIPPAAQLYTLILPQLVSALELGKSAGSILGEYPVSNYENKVGLALTRVGTDVLFSCPGRRVAQSVSSYVPTFAYEFNDPKAPNIFNLPPTNFPYGSFHASELPYLFDSTTFAGGGHAPFSPEQEQLSAAMIEYWTQFAKTGDPNAPRVPQWPGYTVANDTYQSLQPPTPTPTNGFALDHHCSFWDAP